MFTGIITDIGTVRQIEIRGDTRFRLETRYDMTAVDLGASIACAGCCLTVVAKSSATPHWFDVDVSAESLGKTNLGGWRVGTKVNLERALRVGDELGGHIVTGHVDGVGQLISRTTEGDSLRLWFRLPTGLAAYVATKGSVTVEGVSLTVNAVSDDGFGVNIIPHTQKHTTLGSLQPGDAVNIEIDVLARYVARLASQQGLK